MIFMNKIITDQKEKINISNLQLLSTEGSEVLVYHDDYNVYKFFKKDYRLVHKKEKELKFLSSINTSRILMPKKILFNDGNLIGFTMNYIKEEKDIYNDSMKKLLNELVIIAGDIELLSKFYIRLMDINKNNIVYNGKLYLIDPGNYYINNIDDLLVYFEEKKLTDKDKIDVIRKWNYHKINMLLFELLFMNNPDIDFYLLRKIIEFFMYEREKESLLYDINIYQKYFELDIPIKESINKFVEKYIKIDEEERKTVLSLYLKHKKYGENL